MIAARAYPLLAVLVLLSACRFTEGYRGQEFNTMVSSLTRPGAGDKRLYYISPGDPDVQPKDLQFLEFATYASRALEYQGFKYTDDPTQAEVVVYLSYGIGEPSIEYRSRTKPTVGMVQSGSTTNIDVNSAGTSATATTTPSYAPGVTGHKTVVKSTTSYDRYVALSAVDLAHYNATGENVELWRTTVTSTGSSGDIRRVAPVLFASALGLLATSTGRAVPRSLREREDRIGYIRGRIQRGDL